MSFYQLIKTQQLPVTISEIWDFISSTMNLKEITPEHMGFVATSNTVLEKIYPGMIISYKGSPFPSIKLDWVTESTC
jgi:ligand-binding SRPBCC domain-containing protein